MIVIFGNVVSCQTAQRAEFDDAARHLIDGRELCAILIQQGCADLGRQQQLLRRDTGIPRGIQHLELHLLHIFEFLRIEGDKIDLGTVGGSERQGVALKTRSWPSDFAAANFSTMRAVASVASGSVVNE